MDYENALLELIAYCQRQDVLSSDTKVIEELAEILGVEEIDIEALLY